MSPHVTTKVAENLSSTASAQSMKKEEQITNVKLQKNDEADEEEEAIREECDSISETSTERWEHESFETFQQKVKLLVRDIFPHSEANIDTIERLEGGDNNRIVGVNITIAKKKPKEFDFFAGSVLSRTLNKMKLLPSRFASRVQSRKQEETSTEIQRYILRIPRRRLGQEDDEKIDLMYDCAILRFAQHITNFPTPKVVRIDITSNNPLGSRYVLQERLRGKRLDGLWEELNHQQRICLAKNMAELLSQLARFHHPTAGIIDANSVLMSEYRGTIKESHLNLFQFDYERDYKENRLPAKESPPVRLVEELLLGWRAHGKFKHGEHFDDMTEWENLAKLARYLHEGNDVQGVHSGTAVFGPHNRYYFCHGDLYPRNILVEVVDERTVKISGILDWDDMYIGPAVVAFEAPSWLWKWREYDSGELEAVKLSEDADGTPEDEEAKAIKTAFEEAISSEFLEYAYAPYSDVARWLWHWAVNGIGQAEEFELADDVLAKYGLSDYQRFLAAQENEAKGEGTGEGEDDGEYEDELERVEDGGDVREFPQKAP
jgi:aminoglycoside phosphotransferase (APT) family kinase protein